MNKKSTKRKKIIALLSVIILILSIVGYTKWKVNAEIDPITVYYTKQDIPPRTQITEEMIYERSVSSVAIPPEAATKKEKILGKWTVPGYGYNKNSLIYTNKLITSDAMPDAGTSSLKENEVTFPLIVDIESSLGNSILPETEVDLYFKGFTTELVNDKEVKKAIYGKVAEKVRVTSVKDSNATNVFTEEIYTEKLEEDTSSTDGTKIPMANILVFAVKEEQNLILNKGKIIGEIVPVVAGKTGEQKANLNMKETQEWINSQAYSFTEKETTNQKN